ncbi:hypothetical protein S40285_04828 [Stachybotrys chlorohalonatus IBT 40285]|uniref:AB hydrolase-1 domain-containing protein n=1 Tax=Stachybotrys chlorohalonatus (strain IBT 40285) TaxID=1283841 RepID=A0A084QA84_STAC4|nr:hypothetical protein S40285_04828 [Stachybotrys chlorohalonata IBT 40285]
MSNLHYTFKWLSWSRPSGAPRPPPEGLERHWVETPDGRIEVLAAVPTKPSGGPPLVFVHGGMGCAWVWGDYMRYCASKHGITCYAVSLRGHGESWHPSYLKLVFGTTRRMLADDLVASIRWVQDREGGEVVLVGHSSGGGLSQDILSQGDVSVKGLALLGAVPAFGSMGVYRNWARLDPWFSLRMLLHGWHPNSPLSHPVLVRRAFFSNDVSDAYLSEFQGRLSRYESFWWALSMMRAFADPARTLAHIDGGSASKMLIMTGSEDKIVTPTVAEQLAAFYREAAAGREAVEVLLVPTAGHHLQNDLNWEDGAIKLVGFYKQL